MDFPLSRSSEAKHNVEVQGTIGVHINIMDIVKKDFDSRAIFSIKKPIVASASWASTTSFTIPTAALS